MGSDDDAIDRSNIARRRPLVDGTARGRGGKRMRAWIDSLGGKETLEGELILGMQIGGLRTVDRDNGIVNDELIATLRRDAMEGVEAAVESQVVVHGKELEGGWVNPYLVGEDFDRERAFWELVYDIGVPSSWYDKVLVRRDDAGVEQVVSRAEEIGEEAKARRIALIPMEKMRLAEKLGIERSKLDVDKVVTHTIESTKVGEVGHAGDQTGVQLEAQEGTKAEGKTDAEGSTGGKTNATEHTLESTRGEEGKASGNTENTGWGVEEEEAGETDEDVDLSEKEDGEHDA